MNQKLAHICVVIPALNEENNIENAINKAEEIVQKITDNYNIIVINDGSVDKTKEILDKLKKTKLKIIHHEKNLGIDATFKELYSLSNGEYTFSNCADGDIEMDVLLKYYDKAKSTGADIIVGNRITKSYKLKRKVVSYSFNRLTWVLTGYNLYDPGTSKFFKTNVIQSVKTESKSVFGEAERLVRALRNGAKLEKVDIMQVPKQKSDKVNIFVLFHCTFDLFKFAIKKKLNLLE